MPTSRPRHLVTETDQVAAALDAAARRWPDLSRAALLARLAIAGERSLAAADEKRRDERVAAVQRYRGALTGTYGDGYLEGLRREWPP